jgi:adenylate cyclase
MKASLRSFGHYVPKELVRSLLAAGRDAELGGERRLLSLHFSDVADFTAISEGMSPEALVEAMGRYFELMTDTITSQGGTVDKFMGDGILAFFNAPDDVADHPAKACAAALDAQERLGRAATLAAAAGTPVFRARIGLGLGEVLVGNIGTRERFAYTVLGDEVNLASRLESLNKIYGTAIMASEAMCEATGDLFEWRRLDRVAVKGRQQGTLVCELMGHRGGVAEDSLKARDIYEAGLSLYFDRRFAEATRVFQQALALRPGDRAAMALAARAERYAAAPPEKGWSGIEIMKAK